MITYLTILLCHAAMGSEFRGQVVDASSGTPIAARVYLRNEPNPGKWFFLESASPNGSAFPYQEQWVPMAGSVEKHTTVSAHPFRADLPPGKYSIEIERGKEYLTLRSQIEISDRPVEQDFRLTRWINMAERGWYSGETHVHRRIHELPNVMSAEDLNVAFPVTFWTTRSDEPPNLKPSTLRSQGPSPFGNREDRGTSPIYLDANHVIVPRNTEYEIFSIGEKRHTLGAVFVLNHKTPFTLTAPPVGPIAEQAHAEGALLDLDKHSWPWSMMLVPIAKVDLFELSNNSVWRTQFGFSRVSEPLPSWLQAESQSPGTLTEWGWLNYGFQMYYALLNCGFRLSPTAGTASGVHPVPLGYSRVYVHTGDRFNLDAWLQGLKAGRSFVTTGPMLFARVDGRMPDEPIAFPDAVNRSVEVDVESISSSPISQLDLIVNGEVVESVQPRTTMTASGAHQAQLKLKVAIRETSWLALRSIEIQPDGRRRFAHTAPWHVAVANQKIRPKREQVEYFISLMSAQIERNRDILSKESLREFETALDTYQRLLKGS